jgi:hypothetical protein
MGPSVSDLLAFIPLSFLHSAPFTHAATLSRNVRRSMGKDGAMVTKRACAARTDGGAASWLLVLRACMCDRGGGWRDNWAASMESDVASCLLALRLCMAKTKGGTTSACAQSDAASLASVCRGQRGSSWPVRQRCEAGVEGDTASSRWRHPEGDWARHLPWQSTRATPRRWRARGRRTGAEEVFASAAAAWARPQPDGSLGSCKWTWSLSGRARRQWVWRIRWRRGRLVAVSDLECSATPMTR